MRGYRITVKITENGITKRIHYLMIAHSADEAMARVLEFWAKR